MTDYKSEIIKVSDLTTMQQEAMCRLYLSHYDGCDESRFVRDLAEKCEALMIYRDQQLVGFTLYALYREVWQGRELRVIYSGDTIVERAHWGQQALAFSWINRAGEIKRIEPDTPLFWFLIVKGHRTYRYLPAFSIEYYPHWSRSFDPLKTLADWLAERKFGENYDPDRGVISFPRSRGQLKESIAYPTQREASKAAVKFFLQRNPGYAQGEEMVCLCELSEDNLRPLARRLFSS
jgi:hypothetical protein